ncbi:hypothetical protein [Hymenobacter rubidus]|uniref:hypothetical protein n=1 Tax=Hymenobacter rubidus TaxID=1441626 RepID=UPI00191D0355|nr:hypothetical protein [Hymenobacter rubidus]
MESPCFLALEQYHLSKGEAKRIVIEALLNSGTKSPKGGWERANFNIQNGESKSSVSFHELLEATRNTGVVPYLQFSIDRSDDVLEARLAFQRPLCY